MSQVVVVDDNLKDKRLSSKKEEKAIDRDSQFRKWQMSDITGPSLVLKLIGLATMPIVFFWSILGLLSGLALAIAMAIFNGISRLIPKKRG